MQNDIRDLVQCAYCCKEVPAADVTEDHVIARSWYPADTPPTAKWKVPACTACNNHYSAVEESTLTRLALCLDPADKSVRQIAQRAIRSFDPKQAKSARDAMHRFNKRQAIFRDLKHIDDPKAPGVLPSFRRNFEEGSRTGILIPAANLKKVVGKWVRGIYFSELGQPVPADHVVSVYFVDDDVAASAFAEIMRFAKQIQKGPGVEVLIWHAMEGDEAITQYAFKIWRQFRAYGSVESGGLLEQI
ncbi:MAG: hypothetical protein IIA68_07195 [Proteobacteria bacterium]|nr:hypothetical protein [Pseudomonadota bacterium]